MKAALLLLLGLPGQVFIYQGEELGLEEVDVPDEARQDPWFIRTDGREKGRDGCRVPLPWHRGRRNAGFSKAPPWLPMPFGWDRLAVDAQLASPDHSMLGHYQRALAARRRIAGWLDRRLQWRDSPSGVLAYSRGPLTVACNFLDRASRLPVSGRLLLASDPLAGVRGGIMTLPPNSSAWLVQ